MQKRAYGEKQSTYSGKNGHTHSKKKSRVLFVIQIELLRMAATLSNCRHLSDCIYLSE